MTEPRIPAEAKPPRMERLARLPVFFGLSGKRAVLAGGTAPRPGRRNCSRPPARRSMSSLTTYRTSWWRWRPIRPAARSSCTCAPGGTTILSARRWRSARSSTDDEAARFAAAARAAGVPVNVIDKPAFCDFSFGSIVNRSPLVIGISTDGAAPVFAQAIRAKLEALIPFGFARWADAARRWRDAVRTSGLPFAARRRFWQMFTATALNDPDREPAQADYDRLLAETQDEGAKAGAGSVTLVGAGPGDPELLTLRAVRALQSADVILIDDLVAPAILDFARREAKKMMVGKTGFAPSCKQDEINALMVSLAKAGRRVVRLKGGDPMIFGRAGEEIAACREAGIPVEVVPGISAAQGAASRLGVSLTHRKLARRIQYVTAHGADGKLPVRYRLGKPRRSRHHHRGLYAEARARRARRNGTGARAAGGYAGDRRRRRDAAGAGGHCRNDRGYRVAARRSRARRIRCW